MLKNLFQSNNTMGNKSEHDLVSSCQINTSNFLLKIVPTLQAMLPLLQNIQLKINFLYENAFSIRMILTFLKVQPNRFSLQLISEAKIFGICASATLHEQNFYAHKKHNAYPKSTYMFS